MIIIPDDEYAAHRKLMRTVAAASIIAEIGVNMEQFPTADHLSSWDGMSPGNNETAGKKRAEKTTHGNKALKTTLTESSWAASRTKNCYLKAIYHSLVGRRGKKQALIAMGHKILVMIYHILKT